MADLQTTNESEILSRVIVPQEGNLSAQVAEVLLNLSFPERDIERMHELAEKIGRGK